MEMKNKVISRKRFFYNYRALAMGLIALMLMVLVVIPACSSSEGWKGKSAPVFTLEDLDGNQVILSELQGKAVFLNFWTTTCPPCKAEMPAMEKLYQNYKGQNIAIVGIDIHESDTTVRQFVEDNEYSWTFVIDKTWAVSNKYEIEYTPTSFFIDSEGIIRAVEVGGMSYETMEANLLKVINKE